MNALLFLAWLFVIGVRVLNCSMLAVEFLYKRSNVFWDEQICLLGLHKLRDTANVLILSDVRSTENSGVFATEKCLPIGTQLATTRKRTS